MPVAVRPALAAAAKPSSDSGPSGPTHASLLVNIALLQSSDGSFTPSPALAVLLAVPEAALIAHIALGLAPAPPALVWSTVVVLAFLDGRLRDRGAEWVLLAAKARRWLDEQGVGTDRVEQLMIQARELIGIS